ncbi:MAG TPA: hypothetical protein VMH35_14575 [Streptosporangiaceae bacterium]|nr:hypothetical protein [Streptosporangiaceae bacterium]
MNRAAFFPGLRSTGSVHNTRMAGRTGLYFGLQPLQSTSLVAFGAIRAEAGRRWASAPLAQVAEAGPARANWVTMTLTAADISAARQAGRRSALGT